MDKSVRNVSEELHIDQERINFAFSYAGEKHSKQHRKGTTIPYIVHIYEVYEYLREERADEETLIAGVLHDVVEDTGTSIDEIKEHFGENIANLVSIESEVKGLPYLVRKTMHMQKLKQASDNAKLINCADKLSNLRTIYLDKLYFKDKFWSKFNAPKEEIQQYYTMAIDALSSIKDRDIYKQLCKYYDLTFKSQQF